MSRLRANIITNRMANGAPTVSNGLVISGITTTSEVNVGQGVTFSTVGNATFSGIVTATSFSGSGANLTSLPAANLTGTLPAISGANLTGITQTTINNNADNRVITGSGTANTLNGESNVIIDSSGRLLIGTTTEGQGNADELTLSFNNTGVSGGDQGRCGMTIRSGDNTSGVTQNGYIYFSDGTSGGNEYRGVVAYSHSDDSMYLSTAGTERLRISSTGVIQTGSKTITGGNNLAIQGYAVKGVWSGSPSIGKSIELISGYDSAVKMAAIGYNLTDTNTGSTYGGDLTFHTQPLYSSPTTPIPESMRISSSGYVTKPKHPSFCARHQGSDGFSGDIIVLTRISTSWDVWNTGGHYSTSTGKFTAPVAGVYYFEGQVMSTGHSNGDNIQDMLSLESNNGRIAYCRQRESYFSTVTNANGYYTNSVGSSVRLSVGDTVWIQRHSSQNWSYSNRYYSYFTGWLIG